MNEEFNKFMKKYDEIAAAFEELKVASKQSSLGIWKARFEYERLAWKSLESDLQAKLKELREKLAQQEVEKWNYSVQVVEDFKLSDEF